ncbi:MAG TPA: hypothetical protein VF584_22945 [Longimicrobium sp.]|jgi:hypothetical protein
MLVALGSAYFLLAFFLSAVHATAQPGEGWEPTRCPETWRPGPYRGVLLIGSLTQFKGYYFNVFWQRSSEGFTGQGFYRPQGGVVPVEAILQRVEWLAAGIVVACWRKPIRRPSGITSYVLKERIVDRIGRIVPHDSNGDENGGMCHQLEDDPYDPYSPTDDPGCPGPDSGGSTDGGGGGEGDKPACRTEYVLIEISYDNGVTWEVYWEGYATVCD